jgi:hypothetical protein
MQNWKYKSSNKYYILYVENSSLIKSVITLVSFYFA